MKRREDGFSPDRVRPAGSIDAYFSPRIGGFRVSFLVSGSHGSCFLRLRKQRNVTCLCLPRSPPLVSLFSLLPIFRAAAVLRSSIDRSCGAGRRGECLRGSIERIALAYSHRVTDRPSKFPSVPRSIVRTIVRSRAVLLFCGSREVCLSGETDRAIAKTVKKQNVPTRSAYAKVCRPLDWTLKSQK